MFISETIIDAVVDQLETADFEKEIEFFGKKQPALMSYLFSEDFELLTHDEREWMLYLFVVIWSSVVKAKEQVPSISKKSLEMAEERNWELLDSVTTHHFRDRMDVFFNDSEQEDLLAFIEDSLVEDDDSVVTKEGREPMFVALKSVVDVLTA
jgi:hypothetical protein